MESINSLQPTQIWDAFSRISSIPHGSGHTKALSDYCVSVAKEHGLEVKQDDANNVIIYLSGSVGREQEETIILQGHIDMVCDKTDDCPKDMDKEPIELCTDGEFVWADKTTLGGDDGIAIAYMLALIEDDSISHPPLELLFTSDEEVGMLGAIALDASSLNGKKLINIDSEVEGVLTVSCAGGVRATCSMPIVTEEATGEAYTIRISGLRGGHSGTEINTGRISAIRMLGRILNYLDQESTLRISSVDGGKKYNAIPNEAEAVVIIDSCNKDAFFEAVDHFRTMMSQEIALREPDVCFTVATCELPSVCMDLHTTKKVLFILLQIPDGVQTMSPDIPDMVQTSLNFGILETVSDHLAMSFLLRSNAAAGKQAVIQKLTSFVEYLGGRIEFSSDYPAWEYRADSVLREKMTKVYADVFGTNPKVTSIHAGLECGILSGKISDMDAVSFGPNIFNAHTPQEKLEVSSAERCWTYLKVLLEQI